jgi:hypothetical protein
LFAKDEAATYGDVPGFRQAFRILIDNLLRLYKSVTSRTQDGLVRVGQLTTTTTTTTGKRDFERMKMDSEVITQDNVMTQPDSKHRDKKNMESVSAMPIPVAPDVLQSYAVHESLKLFPQDNVMTQPDSKHRDKKNMENVSTMPIPVAPDVLQSYAVHESRPTIKLFPGCMLRIEGPKQNKTVSLLDFQRGKLVYGTGANAYVTRSQVEEGRSRFFVSIDNEWRVITTANWDDILVKQMPSHPGDLMMGKATPKAEDNLHNHGMEENAYRNIDSLPLWDTRSIRYLNSRPLLPVRKTKEHVSPLCFICGSTLESTLHPQLFDGLGPCSEIIFLDADQERFLVAHVRSDHPKFPFAFMVKWKLIHEARNANMKAFVQEAIFTAYRSLGGIDPKIFRHMYETQSDLVLKTHLASIFGFAISYVSGTFPNNLAKRCFIKDWKPQGADILRAKSKKDAMTHYLNCLHDCVQEMMESCVSFNFVAFLLHHKGNWESMWNTMDIFFSRGLFFDSPYPPFKDGIRFVEENNLNIVDLLNETYKSQMSRDRLG